MAALAQTVDQGYARGLIVVDERGYLIMDQQEFNDLAADRMLPELDDDSDCFGLAWTLLHLIESTPSWPTREALAAVSGPWGELLSRRVARQ